MYYVMDCSYPRNEAGGYLDVDSGIDIEGVDSWSLGRRINVPIPNPIELPAVPKRGYDGPPIEMLDGYMLIMSDRLVQALQEAGVDNLDVYPAVIRNTKTGQTYSYKVVNIIGLVAAADLEKSQWRSHDPQPLFDVTFDSLAVREDAPGGALMFRLAEKTSVILVHQRVRDYVLSKGIDTLKFIEPKDFSIV